MKQGDDSIIRDLVRIYRLKAQIGDKRKTEYWKTIATETANALEELLARRAADSIPVEGVLSSSLAADNCSLTTVSRSETHG